MPAKIGVLGSGPVGEALSNGFLKYGYSVIRGSRNPEKLKQWRERAGSRAETATFSKTAEAGEILVLAIKGTAAEKAIDLAGRENFSGKVIIDTTNPIAEEPPVHGVLRFFTGPNESLHERLQKKVPKARFVKVFNSVGNQFMVDPDFGGIQPSMFYCGNDRDAKNTVREFLVQFGWQPEDMGEAEAARAIEPLCMLWCIPGLRQGHWNHAFKLLKK